MGRNRFLTLSTYPQMGGIALLILIGLSACGQGGRPSPRSVALEVFAAMRTSDSTFLRKHVDLERIGLKMRDDLMIPAIDTSAIEPIWADRLLASFTGEGTIRERWLSNQIVLGKHATIGDTALVELSFIDRVTHMQHYNKMRLVYQDSIWIITDFRTM